MALRNVQKQIEIGQQALRQKGFLDLQLQEIKKLFELSSIDPGKPITFDMLFDAVSNSYKVGLSVGILEGKRITSGSGSQEGV